MLDGHDGAPVSGSASVGSLWGPTQDLSAETLRALAAQLGPFSPDALEKALQAGDVTAMRERLLPGLVQLLAENTRTLPAEGAAAAVLYTVPSSHVYEGNLFHWDCALGAVEALRAARDVADPRLKAALEALATQSLFAMARFQVRDGPNRGMFSHMGFDGGDSAALWRDPHQSTLTQPPLFALAVRALPDADARRALEPFARENLQWWLRERVSEGLPFVIHPWETGCDAGPNMDAALSPYLGPPQGDFVQLQTKNPGRKNEAAKVGRGNLLAAQQARAEALGVHPKHLPASEARALFEAFTPDMAAHLVRALEAGAALSEEAGHTDEAVAFRAAAEQMRAAVREQLWDPEAEFFRTRSNRPSLDSLARANLGPDAIDENGRVRTDVGTAFTVLAAGIPTRAQALKLVEALRSERFNTRHPIPSLATDDPRFVADDYWRGSTWINVNYFVLEGLQRYAVEAQRDGDLNAMRAFAAAGVELAQKTVELAGVHGFYEFYWSQSPPDGAAPGCGPAQLTWSGLSYPALDLLETLVPLATAASRESAAR